MKKLTSLIKKIQEEGKTANTEISDVILKISEEMGEIAAEDLKVRNIKPTKKGENPIQNLKEESCDLLLASLDLVLRQMEIEEAEDILEIKLNKWLSYKKNK